MRKLAATLLFAGCTVVNPDELLRTACESSVDCPRAGDGCCDGFCQPTCSLGGGLGDGGTDAGTGGGGSGGNGGGAGSGGGAGPGGGAGTAGGASADAGADAGTDAGGPADAGSCAGLPNGATCRPTQLGPCMFNGLACTGDRLETQWRCDGAGACKSSSTLLMATAACTAQREAVQCASPTYSACRYAQTCSTSGDRDRIDAVCNSGSCLTRAPVLLQNDPACARSTDTVACGTGQRCSSGQCRCDATACGAAFGANRGCCDGDTCRAGTSTSACGANGYACSICTALECCGPSTANPGGPTACRTLCL